MKVQKKMQIPLQTPQRPQPAFSFNRVWVHFTFCCQECTHFARPICIYVDACRSNQVIVPSARILLGPVCTNFTQTQNKNKEINLPHETAHTSLRPRIPIWKVNSPLPVTDENKAWRSPNLPTGRSPGQTFITVWDTKEGGQSSCLSIFNQFLVIIENITNNTLACADEKRVREHKYILILLQVSHSGQKLCKTHNANPQEQS